MPKGKINAYICTLGHATITIDRDEGTTPFTIGCDNCKHPAYSQMYRTSQDLEPTHEWVRLSDEEIKEEAKEMAESKPDGYWDDLEENMDMTAEEFCYEQLKDHADRGGLFLRKIEEEQ